MLTSEIKAAETTATTADIASMLDAGGCSKISTMVDATSVLHEHVVTMFQHAQMLATAMQMPTKSFNDWVAIVAFSVRSTGTVAIVGVGVVHDD